MAISAKVTDQLVTESGTTVTVMDLSPFTHIDNTEATIEAGVACQPYGVVMAPADAPNTQVTFSQEGAESILVNLDTIIDAEKGNTIISDEENAILNANDPIWLYLPHLNTPEWGVYDDRSKIYIGYALDGSDLSNVVALASLNGLPDAVSKLHTPNGDFDLTSSKVTINAMPEAKPPEGTDYVVSAVNGTVNAIYASSIASQERIILIDRADINKLTFVEVT